VTTFLCQEQPDTTIPEDTIVNARVDSVKVEKVEYVDKDTKEEKSFEKVTWYFEITEAGPDGQWQGRRIQGRTGAKLTNHPNNRFRNWAEALLKRDISVGFQLSTEDLTGLPCKITVRHEPDRRDPKTKWERVDEVLPGDVFDNQPPF
jgi:hypothetical protein